MYTDDIDVVVRWAGRPSAAKKMKAKVAGVSLPPYTDDLKYCLRSVAKNMTWARRVFLVLDDDELLPPWLTTTTNAKKHNMLIIRHSEFIPSEYLPTYNSNVIDSFLHRIIDLAERFVVFDDDCFILKRVRPSVFFDSSDGRPITRMYNGPERHALDESPIMFVKMWQLGIREYGICYTRMQHQAQPFLKSLLNLYERGMFAKRLVAMQQHRVRHAADVNVLRFTSGLMTMHQQNHMVKTTFDVDLFVEAPDFDAMVAAQVFKRTTRPVFLCVNNTAKRYTQVYKLLERIFPAQSMYEKNVA